MKNTTRIPLPSPSPGTERSLIVHRYGQAGARPKAYLQAALHADEHPGLLVQHHLLRLLDSEAAAHRIRGEIVVVPMANPIGLGQHLNGYLVGRFDFDGTGNFNRDFPDLTDLVRRRIEGRLGKNPQSNAALIRQALLAVLDQQGPRYKEANVLRTALLKLSIDADYVFDLHCDSEALLHLYASHHHRDTALELAAQIGTAVVLLEEEAGGNPFDEANAGPWWKLRIQLPDAAIPLGCFSTTVELRGQTDVNDRYAEADAANLVRFLKRHGVIDGDPGPLPKIAYVEAPLEGVDILTAPASGLLAYRKELGERVEKGETVVDLVDLTCADPTKARTPLRAQTSGILFTRLANKLVRPGQSVCKIAGSDKLSYRIPGKLLEN